MEINMKVRALGEHIILVAKAKSAGTELVSKTIPGLIIGMQESGEIPETCEVYSIGPKVPEGIVELGDVVPLTNGIMRNVLNPDVVSGKGKPSDFEEKYVTTHYNNLVGVYYK